MVPAAFRLAFIGATVVAGCLHATVTPPRAAPTRPGAAANPQTAGAASSTAVFFRLPTKKLGGIDYVSIADAARRLDLQVTWNMPGQKVALSRAGARVVLEAEAREIQANGMRVFLGEPVRTASGQLYVSRSDLEANLTPLLRPGFGVHPVPPTRIVVLDPGHGGRDNGTSTHEKTYTLDVARRARKLLEASGFQVALTRDEDVFVGLAQRSAFANIARADLFVSIHFNALSNDTRTSGVEIYSFPPQGQRSTNSWSPLRKSDAEPEASPANRNDHWNTMLAHALHRRLVGGLQAFDRGKKLMHLGVLRGLACPGVLVECGFLTSEAEARRIATEEYRQQIAEMIAAGIRDYAATMARVRTQS